MALNTIISGQWEYSSSKASPSRPELERNSSLYYFPNYFPNYILLFSSLVHCEYTVIPQKHACQQSGFQDRAVLNELPLEEQSSIETKYHH